MRIKIKKLHPNAVTPIYANESDAGMHLLATEIISNTTFQVTYGTGLAFEIPDGMVSLIFPLSSIRNTELMLSNAVGVIDAGYRGELQTTFVKLNGLDSIAYNIGDKIAQIIIVPVPIIQIVEVDELSESNRVFDGFGSTTV